MFKKPGQWCKSLNATSANRTAINAAAANVGLVISKASWKALRLERRCPACWEGFERCAASAIRKQVPLHLIKRHMMKEKFGPRGERASVTVGSTANATGFSDDEDDEGASASDSDNDDDDALSACA